MTFLQDPPQEPDPFQSDTPLQTWVRRLASQAQDDIAAFGARVASEVRPLAEACEANPPRLVRYSPWGKRIDQIRTDPAWRRLGEIAAQEGLVGLAYGDAEPEARVHQAAKLYLFGPNCAIYGCYLAMTDGAARVLEQLGPPELREGAFKRLTSRDPADHWTSGQWMTEKSGGSDVGRSETVAEQVDGSGWRLHGEKWFTSATTSDMALTLARTEDTPGSRGLSLFYVETRSDGAWNGITVHRLKDKLGTRALPTAELTLDGTQAELLGGRGDGVRNIATMLNVTRFHNALNAAGYMARATAMAQDHARRREAFGKPLVDHPLHIETLRQMGAETAGALALGMRVAQLLGQAERGQGEKAEHAARLLRILTPVVKLYTAKQAVAVVSEAVECLGGVGYVEDSVMPRLLRDAQVLPIWEGTTNVLALDLLRAARDGGFEALAKDGLELLAAVGPRIDTKPLLRRLQKHETRDRPHEADARAVAFSLARDYGGAVLAEHAAWCLDEGLPAADHDEVARYWIAASPAPMTPIHKETPPMAAAQVT